MSTEIKIEPHDGEVWMLFETRKNYTALQIPLTVDEASTLGKKLLEVTALLSVTEKDGGV